MPNSSDTSLLVKYVNLAISTGILTDLNRYYTSLRYARTDSPRCIMFHESLNASK
jgi:hypothetical protein